MYFHYIVLRVSTPKIKETYTPKTLHNLSQEGLITCSFSKREESRDLWLFLDLETGGKESKPVTNRDFIVHQNSIVAAVNFEIPVAEILASQHRRIRSQTKRQFSKLLVPNPTDIRFMYPLSSTPFVPILVPFSPGWFRFFLFFFFASIPPPLPSSFLSSNFPRVQLSFFKRNDALQRW